MRKTLQDGKFNSNDLLWEEDLEDLKDYIIKTIETPLSERGFK